MRNICFSLYSQNEASWLHHSVQISPKDWRRIRWDEYSSGHCAIHAWVCACDVGRDSFMDLSAASAHTTNTQFFPAALSLSVLMENYNYTNQEYNLIFRIEGTCCDHLRLYPWKTHWLTTKQIDHWILSPSVSTYKDISL